MASGLYLALLRGNGEQSDGECPVGNIPGVTLVIELLKKKPKYLNYEPKDLLLSIRITNVKGDNLRFGMWFYSTGNYKNTP